MRKIRSLFLVSLLLALDVGVASGLSDNQRRVFDSGARYVNTEEGCESLDSFNASSNLYFIGDSLTVGMNSPGLDQDSLSNQLTTAGWNPTVVAQNCRPLYNASNPDGFTGCGGESGVITSAFNNLESDSSYIRSAGRVVVALGTNALDGNTDSFRQRIGEYLEQLRTLTPSLTPQNVYWVNLYAEGGDVAPIMQERNVALNEEAANIGFNIIDWSSEVQANPDQYPFQSGDNVHHTTEGYRNRATYITSQLGRPSASPSGFAGGGTGISWPADLDARWIEVWEQMGLEYGVDPKIIAAIFTSEHGGNFTSYEGDGGSSSNGGWAQPSSSTATGPFQFLNAPWDDMVRKEPLLPPRTDRGPSDPRNDPVHASRAAAVYLRFLGAPPGLEPGSIDQNFQRASYDDFTANTELTRTAEVPWTVASIAVRYNQGPWWTPGTVQGNNRPNDYMQDSIDTYNLLGGQSAISGFSGGAVGGSCGSTTAVDASSTARVTIDGTEYAFPIQATNETIGRGYTWPCPSICHHDGTAAFDLFLTGPSDDTIGTPVFAITGGEIVERVNTSLRGEDGCWSFHLLGDDGWDYWYAHIVGSPGLEAGRRVQAGDQIATIGPVRCTRNAEGGTSIPHLHIDRGSPMGRGGGSDCCRDSGLIPIMNALYEVLP